MIFGIYGWAYLRIAVPPWPHSVGAGRGKYQSFAERNAWARSNLLLMNTSILRSPRCRAIGAALLVPALVVAGAPAAVAGPAYDSVEPVDSNSPVSNAETINANNSNPAAAARLPQGFDLQSHRGGRGEWTEESAAAFENSLALGVTTLELDIVVSEDDVPVVWHDPSIQADKCEDTGPATEGDPEYPYVGKLVKDLNWDQLQTLRCDLVLDGFPDAEPIEDNRLIQLSDVFSLASGAPNVHFNIETKIEAVDRDQSKSPEVFVDVVMTEVENAGVAERTMIQSFDWRSLPLVRERDANMPLVLLWDQTTWFPGSPWSGPVSYRSVGGDIIEAAKTLDAQVLSPSYASVFGSSPEEPLYRPTATPELIASAHDAGLRVVPWTINDASAMNEQIEAGVDGIITDYPSRLRAVMQERGMEVPQPQ